MNLKVTIKTYIFLILFVAVVAPSLLVMSLSYFNSKNAVETMVESQLEKKIIIMRNSLNYLLSSPKKVGAEIVDLIEVNPKLITNVDEISNNLFVKLKYDPNIMSVEFADQNNESIGVARDVFGKSYTLGMSGKNTNYTYTLYELDEASGLKDKVWELNNYDARTTPWYQKAKEVGKPTWTPVYLWPNGEYGMDFVSPVKLDDDLNGVVDTSIRLSTIFSFIEDAKFSPNGQLAILEKDGSIIAGTGFEAEFASSSDLKKKILVTDSKNKVIKEAFLFLQKKYSAELNVEGKKMFVVTLDSKRYYLSAFNYVDDSGLDWLIVAATPENDVIGSINSNIKIEFLIILLIIIVALFISIGASRHITTPLNKLVIFSGFLARGDLNVDLDVKRTDEIGDLSRAFLLMAEKIKNQINSLKKIDKLKNDFLSVVTHELKSPLIPIKSQVQLLLSGDYGKLSKNQQEAVKMILRNEESLNALTSQVLDITKIKSDNLKIILEVADLNEIINNVIADQSVLATEKRISISFLPFLKSPKIKVDKQRIGQVITNLLNNAIKFTPDGGQINIKMEKVNNNIKVTVWDSGIGIDSINVKKIFTPFFQISGSLERKYRGSGLGLAISKGIVQAHGGKIWVESAGLDQGSKFIFEIPIKN